MTTDEERWKAEDFHQCPRCLSVPTEPCLDLPKHRDSVGTFREPGPYDTRHYRPPRLGPHRERLDLYRSHRAGGGDDRAGA